ncbi:MAG: aryldialkylphosphatase, partial [SAR324 cluster bacterium]|nr:aryldialkylphosphatase [SAR324 cluster bacterium]
DLFGHESSYYPLAPIDMPNDATRIDHLMALIEAGYRDRLLVAHDICHKHRMRKYGGDGYSHLLENVLPVMRRKGMSEDDVQALFAANPARIMAFV